MWFYESDVGLFVVVAKLGNTMQKQKWCSVVLSVAICNCNTTPHTRGGNASEFGKRPTIGTVLENMLFVYGIINK